MHLKRLFCLAAVAVSVSAAIAASATAAGTLNGAGSTLVAPLVTVWEDGFHSSTGNSVNYSAVGSGTGIKDISAGTVDFGASDAPMTSAQASGCHSCILIPWALSATGIGYNVPGVKSTVHLHLTGKILAEIYLGQITTWNNSAITKINKGVKLPGTKITPVYRTDGSGDTYAFTNFLDDIDPAFEQKTGPYATTVSWPVGVGAAKNSGVAAAVTSTSGAIGYISGSYLIAQHIATAAVENNAGNYELPNINSILQAAATVTSAALNTVQADGLPIVNPPKKEKIAYPISTFTNVIAKTGSANASLLKQFITYALTTGREAGIGADFAPLPLGVQKYDLTEVGNL